MRRLWLLALAGSVLTGGLVVGGLVLMAIVPTADTIVRAAVAVGIALPTAGLGVVVARRGKAYGIGELLTAFAASLAFICTRDIGWAVLWHHPAELAHLTWLVAVTAEGGIWILISIALLLLLFPDGHLPGRRWRWVPPTLIAAGLIHHAYGAVDTAPYQPPLAHLKHRFGPPPLSISIVALVADLTLLALLIACAVSLPLRYRRSDALRRRQLKWLALAGIGAPTYVLVCLGEVIVTGHSGWVSLVIVVPMLVGIPLSVAIALLRHDLYDVDRVLATGTAYVLASSVLLVAFAMLSSGAGLLFGRGSSVAVAITAALAVLALSPLRRWMQRRVDTRLYPLQQAAFRAIDDLQRAIRLGTARPEDLGERLRTALHDPTLTVGYLVPASDDVVDEKGHLLGRGEGVPVVAGGTTIGLLTTSSGRVAPELLRQVAHACVTLVELVRLRLELSSALREVEASQARMVQVSDHERRRLERDLHDGAQQRLVSLGLGLRVTQRHLDEPIDTSALIDEVVAELGTAVGELRRIAHGLRPSSLDDGLRSALLALTRHVPIPVELDVPTEPLPDEVTTTLYYVASEAITNAVKHAEASRIDVSIALSHGGVRVRVTDDGRGGATLASGSGLAGLSDRVGALGGHLALHSLVRSGTVVEAVVPCAL